jgi:hypothetical protein
MSGGARILLDEEGLGRGAPEPQRGSAPATTLLFNLNRFLQNGTN